MSGHTLRDIIRNENIRKVLGSANIDEKTKENCSRLFEQMQRHGISESEQSFCTPLSI